MMTPEPRAVIRRAAAVAVTKWIRAASVMGIMKSPSEQHRNNPYCAPTGALSTAGCLRIPRLRGTATSAMIVATR
jgi:hypothetical protein